MGQHILDCAALIEVRSLAKEAEVGKLASKMNGEQVMDSGLVITRPKGASAWKVFDDPIISRHANEDGLWIRGYKVNDKHEHIQASRIHAISFFSGAGGLDIGAQLGGVKVIASLDFDEDSVNTMKSNAFFKHSKHHHDSIENFSARSFSKTIKLHKPDKLVLLGGPPCQPFSKAGYWVTHENRLGESDPRNMIGQYLRMIKEIRPDGFVLENVESILHPKNRPTVDALLEAIDSLGYKCTMYRADATDFGVPQRRKRVFFLASLRDISILPIATHGSPTKEQSTLLPKERVLDWIAPFSSDSFFEKEEITSGKTYGYAISEVPPGKNYFALTARDGYPNPMFEANKRFWSFLLKLHPDEPSWTIAAQPGPWVGPFHWTSRRLRVPEVAAIQTFPSDYKFFGSRRSVQRQIGNAVPSLMGKAIVESLVKNL